MSGFKLLLSFCLILPIFGLAQIPEHAKEYSTGFFSDQGIDLIYYVGYHENAGLVYENVVEFVVADSAGDWKKSYYYMAFDDSISLNNIQIDVTHYEVEPILGPRTLNVISNGRSYRLCEVSLGGAYKELRNEAYTRVRGVNPQGRATGGFEGEGDLYYHLIERSDSLEIKIIDGGTYLYSAVWHGDEDVSPFGIDPTYMNLSTGRIYFLQNDGYIEVFGFKSSIERAVENEENRAKWWQFWK